jgi:multimeric flavodoxin WrbA
MDASSKAWFTQDWKDKLAAGFTNSASQNGDKLNTLQQLAVFAAQHSMVWVGLGLLPGNNSSKGSTDDLNRLGSFLGAMAQSNSDQGPEQGPTAADLRTAEHLGRRVAETALRWQRGRQEEAVAA